MSTNRLAEAASVGRATVQRFEQGFGARIATVLALQAALEAAGLLFISDNETSLSGGPGVRLKAASGVGAAVGGQTQVEPHSDNDDEAAEGAAGFAG